MQSYFANAVFNKGGLEFISSNNKELRIDVYRQTIFENICNFLRIIYPGIWKLLGEECSDKLAYDFASNLDNLPNDLNDLGQDFPKFLGKYSELLPYLSDYARYEWLKNKSMSQKDSSAINPTILASISPKKIAKIKFIFLPSIYSFCSDFPINLIEEVAFNLGAEAIDLKFSKTYAIINGGDSFWLEPSIWKVIDMLMKGKAIGMAGDNPEDLSAAIYFLLNNRLVKGIK